MTKPIKVGDLVISHGNKLYGKDSHPPVGRPALVIDTMIDRARRHLLRLKVGKVEWWDVAKDCEKVSE